VRLIRRSWMVTVVGLSWTAAAHAQVPQAGSPGPFVVDVRAATAGTPQDDAFYPPLPAGAAVATRGFGGEVGAHLYVTRWGPAHVGLGGSLARARGTGTTIATPDQPALSTSSTVTLTAPQLSFNFGSRDGWSYVSVGAGPAQIRTVVTSDAAGRETRDSGWVTAVNLGAGARWFLTRHVAFNFDLRLYRLSAGQATQTGPGTPRTLLSTAAIGLSIR